ncbi:MAG: HEAT repeat domain-containing protein [Chloroflexota bacterium]|nr:HEAT repeat domain-containing protein [Chloroflexota bacterium]
MDNAANPTQPLSSDQDANALIHQLCESDNQHCDEIVERLAVLADDAVFPLIERLAAHSDSYVDPVAPRLRRALSCLGAAAVSPLIERLSYAHRPLWDHVVYTLVRISTPSAITAVIEQVRTLTEDVSFQFLDADGFEITENDENLNHISVQGSQWEILETSITNVGPTVLPLLRPFLHDTDRRLRHFAVNVLTWIGDQYGSGYVLDDLLPQLGDADPVVRTAAAYGLQFFDEERAIPAWSAALHDPHPDVRWFAAGKLGTFQSVQVLDALVRVRDNLAEAPAVRDAASWAIHEIQNSQP